MPAVLLEPGEEVLVFRSLNRLTEYVEHYDTNNRQLVIDHHGRTFRLFNRYEQVQSTEVKLKPEELDPYIELLREWAQEPSGNVRECIRKLVRKTGLIW